MDLIKNNPVRVLQVSGLIAVTVFGLIFTKMYTLNQSQAALQRDINAMDSTALPVLEDTTAQDNQEVENLNTIATELGVDPEDTQSISEQTQTVDDAVSQVEADYDQDNTLNLVEFLTN